MKEINKINLSEQTKYRLCEIIGIENYFHQEINQRKLCIKNLKKHVAAFNYIDKILIVLSATSGGLSIISFTSIVREPVGMARACFTLFFSLTTRIIKKLLSLIRNEKKKHDKDFMLAKSKFNSIEILVSQALIDMGISHENLVAILNETDKYGKMKQNLMNVSESQNKMRLNSGNSKAQTIIGL